MRASADGTRHTDYATIFRRGCMTNETFKDIEKLESDLWEAADNLRANSKLTSSDYFMPVLGVIFLRHATNRFEAAHRQIKEDQATGKMPRKQWEGQVYFVGICIFAKIVGSGLLYCNLWCNMAAWQESQESTILEHSITSFCAAMAAEPFSSMIRIVHASTFWFRKGSSDSVTGSMPFV